MPGQESQRIFTFKEKFEELAGRVYQAKNKNQTLNILNTILHSSGIKNVVLAPLLPDLEKLVERLCHELNLNLIKLKPEDSDIHQKIAEADSGISLADFAIATTGTIVEVTLEDAHRLVSSLPRVHVAFLPASRVVSDLEMAGNFIRNYLQENSLNCNITFISGPSRTADIEMQLVLGVHGPQETHIIVCDWLNKDSFLKKVRSFLSRD